MAYRLNGRAGALARVLFGLWLLAVHLLAVERLATSLAASRARLTEAPRLLVVYLRPMALTDPPPVAAYRPPAPQLIEPTIDPPASLLATGDLVAIAVAALPASAPAIDALPVDPAAAPLPDAVIAKTEAEAPSDAHAEAGEPAESPASAPTTDRPPDQPPGFTWPASTRLSYVLTGNYRGEVHGSAQVEWINVQPRYQVNLDVTVGLPFAPLYKREMRSDGRLDGAGLHPLHFQQQSKLAFQPLRRIGLQIGAQTVTADDGRQLPRSFATADAARRADLQTGLQDSASQFVQMTYLFTTQPQLLTPGTRIAFPLLLPSGVRDWVYEVGQKQTIHTHFGAIEAFHVRSATGLSRGRDQLLAEAWFAPRLAYLPVRLRIEQHADLYLDMVLERIPELAAP